MLIIAETSEKAVRVDTWVNLASLSQNPQKEHVYDSHWHASTTKYKAIGAIVGKGTGTG